MKDKKEIFFTTKQKRIAFKTSPVRLSQLYHESEKALIDAVNDEYKLKQVMDKQHHDIEYAYLFQKTKYYQNWYAKKKREKDFERLNHKNWLEERK